MGDSLVEQGRDKGICGKCFGRLRGDTAALEGCWESYENEAGNWKISSRLKLLPAPLLFIVCYTSQYPAIRLCPNCRRERSELEIITTSETCHNQFQSGSSGAFY